MKRRRIIHVLQRGWLRLFVFAIVSLHVLARIYTRMLMHGNFPRNTLGTCLDVLTQIHSELYFYIFPYFTVYPGLTTYVAAIYHRRMTSVTKSMCIAALHT